MWLPRSVLLYRGKYGVWNLLDVWVQPVTTWVRAQPQHLHKALPVLPPRRRKGQVFSLVSLIWKECGVPSDSGETPKYINLLIPVGHEKSSEGRTCWLHFLKQFWLFMRGGTCSTLPVSRRSVGIPLSFRVGGETRRVKAHQSPTQSPDWDQLLGSRPERLFEGISAPCYDLSPDVSITAHVLTSHNHLSLSPPLKRLGVLPWTV